LNVWAIVLAAGEGRRLGGGKLTLPYGGTTIIGAVVSALESSAVARIVAVVGRYGEQIQSALESVESVSFVVNPRPQDGMLGSIKRGVESIPDDVDGFLIVLGDQPEVPRETIDALISAANESDRLMFIPMADGRRGHPVLFRFTARDSILALSDNVRLNTWRDDNPELVQLVPVESTAILEDIDTPEDYREAILRAPT